MGAGIGGLTTALFLQHVGIECRVIEAVPAFAPVGVGITLLPHASHELARLGLESQLASEAILTREEVFYTRFGQLVYREPTGRFAGYADPQYSIHRAHLHNVLLGAVRDRLGPQAVLSGHRLVGFEQNRDGVIVQVVTPDGASTHLSSDVVVAADGVHSVVRKQLFPQEGPPRYSGVMMWRGTTLWQPFLSGATMIRAGTLATGQLVCYPIQNLNDGSGRQRLNWVVEWQTDQRTGRDWNKEGRLQDFIGCFTDWDFPFLDVPGMLSAAEQILEYPMVDQDPLPRWSHDRVTLLGDAAHPMVPRGSNGAGQTIIDARTLADCMAGCRSDPVSALQAYDEIRRPATAAVVVASRTRSPDLMLKLVAERSGDAPFRQLDDVITQAELRSITEDYKRVAGLQQAATPTGSV